MQTSAAVEVRGLSKDYPNGVRAVDHISLTVERGEVYGFLGPNGAGKTTTVRMLLGLIAPTEGHLSILGEAPGSPASLARIGSLIEGPAFYPYLSGRDNLRILARYGGVDAGRIDHVLDLVSLADRSGDKYAGYSLGMKQRLGVAGALLNDPELVILDEPTNGLDPAGMRDMRALIRKLGDDGHTVLLSSHLLGEVQQICDRVGVINGGKILTEGTVAELRGDAELHITAIPAERAYQLVSGLPEVVEVHRDGDSLRVKAEASATARINRLLVENDLQVTEIRRAERQLEDVFFELTTEASGNDQSESSVKELNHV